MTRFKLIGDPIRRTADGLEAPINSYWYRALPISCIGIEVAIAGQQVPPDRVSVTINERDYALDDLADAALDFWYILDPLRLRVHGVAPGKISLEVNLDLWIPYLFDEETGEVLKVRNTSRRDVVVPDEAVV